MPDLVLNKDIPSLPHYLACTLVNLKHIWTRLTRILRVSLTQLPYEFFSSSSLKVNFIED